MSTIATKRLGICLAVVFATACTVPSTTVVPGPREKGFDCAETKRFVNMSVPFGTDEANSIDWAKREFGISEPNPVLGGSPTNPAFWWESKSVRYEMDLPYRKLATIKRFGPGFPTVGEIVTCIGAPTDFQLQSIPLREPGESDMGIMLYLVFADKGIVAIGRFDRGAEPTQDVWLDIGTTRMLPVSARDILQTVLTFGAPNPQTWPGGIDKVKVPDAMRNP